MYYNYKQTQVHFQVFGNGTIPIVFLHGWGGSIDSFKFLVPYLNKNFKVLIIDFPPFGFSEEPKETFAINDYATLTQEIIISQGFDCPILVGHSFGGRVAIILASKGLCKSLILTSAAGLKPKRGIKYYIKVLKHKFCKFFKIKYNGGSKDYKALSPKMKKTFVNIVSTYLEKYAIHINVPTILFWGKKDKDTPFYMAKRLKKLIKTSEIISFKKSGHFCYIQNWKIFVMVINSFAGVN